MSYNVTSTEYLSGGLKIREQVAYACFVEHEENLAESNPLSDIVPYDGPPDTDNLVDIGCEWSGTWSGNGFKAYLAILAKTEGDAEILVTWEGGDCFEGIRVRGGVVTKHKVAQTLALAD